MKLDQDEIAKILYEKGASKNCHRCGNDQFSVLKGSSNLQMHKDIQKGLIVGGPTVPVIHVVCSNCGAITSHALGALGFELESEESKSND